MSSSLRHFLFRKQSGFICGDIYVQNKASFAVHYKDRCFGIDGNIATADDGKSGWKKHLIGGHI